MTYLNNSDNRNQIDLLIECGWITLLQDGRFIFGDEFNKIMQLLDTIILSWAFEDGAKEIFYPDFYDIDDLKKCNYINQFHTQCYFSSVSLKDTFEEECLSNTKFINNPSICMHSYIQHQNLVIEDNTPIIITAKGKCKRNEINGFLSLERLLDFTMREIIFIGNEKYVLSKRMEYIARINQLIKNLQIEGNVSVSNDPFFVKKDRIKASFQRKFKLKYELIIRNYDNGHDVAVASFNYHNINFSKAYNIHLDNGGLAHTACMAFGLERFAYTYITQVGIENCYKKLSNVEISSAMKSQV